MKKILTLLLALTMLCACAKEEKTTVCRGNDGETKVVNTIKYVGERLTVVSYQNTIEVDESLTGYMETYLTQHKQSVEHIVGLTYEFTIEGNKVVETTTINYEEADLQQLDEEGFISLGSNENSSYVGYAATLDNMIASGYQCTEE